jgi:hypothetical protein
VISTRVVNSPLKTHRERGLVSRLLFTFWPGGFAGSYFYHLYYLISLKHHKLKIFKRYRVCYFKDFHIRAMGISLYYFCMWQNYDISASLDHNEDLAKILVPCISLFVGFYNGCTQTMRTALELRTVVSFFQWAQRLQDIHSKPMPTVPPCFYHLVQEKMSGLSYHFGMTQNIPWMFILVVQVGP